MFLIALKAKSAATSAATRALLRRAVPNCSLADDVDDEHHGHLALLDEDLDEGSFMRAVTFQSMVRTSSPGWYWRTSRNAMPGP